MTEKLTAAEQAFEEWWVRDSSAPFDKTIPFSQAIAKMAYLSADARATERTARRCVELGNADAIAKEFGL